VTRVSSYRNANGWTKSTTIYYDRHANPLRPRLPKIVKSLADRERVFADQEAALKWQRSLYRIARLYDVKTYENI